MKCYKQYVVMGLNTTLKGVIRCMLVFIEFRVFLDRFSIKGPNAQ